MDTNAFDGRTSWSTNHGRETRFPVGRERRGPEASAARDPGARAQNGVNQRNQECKWSNVGSAPNRSPEKSAAEVSCTRMAIVRDASNRAHEEHVRHEEYGGHDELDE